jgi:transcriptional regulator with XRE-family HTH domain
VAHHPLQNYLRTHRRRAGLSQEDVAALLGAASGAKVSRHENYARKPAVTAIFAYEIVFSQPVSKLFAGAYEEVRHQVRSRAKRLMKELTSRAQESPSLRVARKLELLRAIVDTKPRSSQRT